MNLKHLMVDLRIVFNDKRFKLRYSSDSYKIINKLEDILVNITKLNDALGNLSYFQSYYSNIFTNNKLNYADYNFNCNDLYEVIEDEQDEYINIHKDFIELLYNNEDLQELLKDKIPNTIKILNKIKEQKYCNVILNELYNLFYKWLTYISYEEDTFDIVKPMVCSRKFFLHFLTKPKTKKRKYDMII